MDVGVGVEGAARGHVDRVLALVLVAGASAGVGLGVAAVVGCRAGQLGSIGGHASGVHCAWMVLAAWPGCHVYGLTSIVEPRMKHHLPRLL